MDDQHQLAALGLSSGLMALASGNPPHPAFAYRCGLVYKFPEIHPEERPEGLVPLWECGTAVVGCVQTPQGLEFVRWSVEADDPPELIARSEQGLLFWLFSYLIEDADWEDEEAAVRRLRAAAVAVAFRYFDEVNEFQQQRGSDPSYDELLRTAACELPA
jgi:hypothetical protein